MSPKHKRVKKIMMYLVLLLLICLPALAVLSSVGCVFILEDGIPPDAWQEVSDEG